MSGAVVIFMMAGTNQPQIAGAILRTPAVWAHGKFANLMDEAFRKAKNYTAHSLILYGKKDEVVPEKPVLNLYRQLPSAVQDQREMTTYENDHHMLLRDLQADVVRKDIIVWIEKSKCPVIQVQFISDCPEKSG